eukprot:8781542-Pyramimonas_sp.AAC.1
MQSRPGRQPRGRPDNVRGQGQAHSATQTLPPHEREDCNARAGGRTAPARDRRIPWRRTSSPVQSEPRH